MNHTKELRNQIDDYIQSIQAIIGFMNFYRYDDASKQMNPNVLIFQGRQLGISSKTLTCNSYVTPDVGIVILPGKNGVLGEVKKSFPQDQTLWKSTFEQLMSYDDNLTGWPTDDQKVNSHDVVLILHQSRAAAVKKYFEANQNLIKFKKPFCIIEFNRSSEADPFFFFRIYSGALSELSVQHRLELGVEVPMNVFVKTYSTIKIYDAEPPMPYLIDLIWTHVALSRVADNPNLRKLKKINIEIEINTIIDELRKKFSFDSLNANETHQPQIPKKEWIIRACEQLIKLKEAEWVDTKNQDAIRIFFKRYSDTLGHFTELCPDPGQMDFFDKGCIQ